MASTAELASTANPVTFAQVADHPVVHYHPDNGLGGWLDEIAAQYGVTLTAITRTRQATMPHTWPRRDCVPHSCRRRRCPPRFPGAVRRLDPPLTRDVITLVTTTDDPLVQRFDADVRRRGVPVPARIAAQLGRRT